MEISFDIVFVIILIVGLIKGACTGARFSIKTSLASILALFSAVLTLDLTASMLNGIITSFGSIFSFLTFLFDVTKEDIGRILITVLMFLVYKSVFFSLLSLFIPNFKRNTLAQIVTPASSAVGAAVSIVSSVVGTYVLFFIISHVADLSSATTVKLFMNLLQSAVDLVHNLAI